MIKLTGKYCKDCKIFIDEVEQEALQTIHNILDSSEFEGTKVRIMPDTHQGKGIVIGFTSPFTNFLNPDHIGVDIGCTVSSTFFSGPIPKDKIPLFEKEVKGAIPQGFSIHNKPQVSAGDWLRFLKSEADKFRAYGIDLNIRTEKDQEKWCSRIGLDLGVFWKSIGTLGGGNHYLEYGEGDGKYVFTVHSGSRNLGQKVWRYWKNISEHNKISKEEERKVVELVKSQNQDKTKLGEEISQALKEYRLALHPGYLSGEDLQGYLEDMVLAQAYAKYSHQVMHKIVEEIYSKITHEQKTDYILTQHNYVDLEHRIIRKGAVRASEGEIFLLPLNMRDGMAICRGKGNKDWNCSCSHGAGRKLSRSKAKDEVSLEEFRETMKNVYTTSVNLSTIDESPQAYKDSGMILDLIRPTAEILSMIKPIINIKAGGDE